MQTESTGIISLICAVIAWIGGCCAGMIFPLLVLFVVPLDLIAVVTGWMAIQRINDAPEHLTGKPLAIAGLVLAILHLLSMVVMAVLVFLGVGAAMLVPMMDQM